MEYNVKLNLDAETSKAEQKINDFASKTGKLRGIADEPAQPVPFQENTAQNTDIAKQQADIQQIEKTNLTTETLGSFVENLKALNDLMPVFSDRIRELSKPPTVNPPVDVPDGKTGTAKLPGWLKKIQDIGAFTLTAAVAASAFQYDASLTRRRTRALDADTFGIEHEKIQGGVNVSNTISSFIPAVTGVIGGALGSVIPGLGTAVGSLAGAAIGKGLETISKAVTSGIGNSADAKVSELERQAQIFQQKTPALEKSLVYYDNPAQNAVVNRYRMEELNSFWTQKAMNTGMSTEEFTSLANSLSEYGVNSKIRAGNLTHEAASMARYTGTDVNTILDFLGNRERLGSNFSKGDLNRAYIYSQEAGLEKGQFGEFLNGLQSAVEQGIAKGYTASTDDISKQMVMFSKLSGGNEAWEGKYGFQKLSQINSGLAGATSLGDSSQILAYQALRGIVGENMKGGAYIKGQNALNTLSLMEAGLNPSSFKAIAESMKSIYGNDVMAQVEAWKKLSGLNYTDAMQLYQMANGDMVNLDDDAIRDKLRELDNNKEFQTDTANIANYVNKIQADVYKISEKGIKVYMSDLKTLETEQYSERKKSEKENKKENLTDEEFIDNFITENFKIEGADDEYYRSLKDALKGKGIGFNPWGETKKTGKEISKTYQETMSDFNLDANEKVQFLNVLKRLADVLNQPNVVVTAK